MKTNYKIPVVLFFVAVALIFIDALNNPTISNNAGAPAGRTGSPGDGGLTCAISGCHLPGPTPATMAGWITSNIPGTGYVPGSTYTITATATRPGHVEFGFEISPQNNAGTLLGTLVVTNSTETQLVGANKYITHKLAGTSGPSGTKTWNFNWTAPVAGTGTVTFYGAFNVTNSNNNSSGDTIYKSTLVVSECAVPAQPSAITGNATVCPGSSQNYSVSAVAGATGYTWTLPSGWTGSSTTNSISVTAGTTSGNITVTANNACGASTVRILSVTVNNVAVSFSQTNVNCFGGNNGSATANPTGGSNPYSFLWSNLSSSATISNLSVGTYTVTVTDAIGCTKTASVTITEPSLLTACSPTSTSICQGDSIQLGCCSGSGGTPPYTYAWSPASSLISTSVCDPVAFPNSSVSYTVLISDAHGCTATSSTTITVNPSPGIPVITQNGDTLFSSITGPYVYQWYINGSPVPGGTSDHYVTLTPGNYTVVIMTLDGCTSASSPYPYFPTGILRPAENMISVYPNPAKGFLFVDVSNEWKNHFMDIRDVSGHVVLKFRLTELRNQIDLSSLDNGVYFIYGETGKGKIAKRFAVMR